MSETIVDDFEAIQIEKQYRPKIFTRVCCQRDLIETFGE